MSYRAAKRPRVMQTVAKRPIDKSLLAVNSTANTSQTALALTTATFPCTVTGLRWDLNYLHTITTGNATVFWSIVVVHDGLSPSTMSTSNGGDMYTPEQDVLAFGVLCGADADAGTGNIQAKSIGNTKTMRKLKAGDSLQLLVLSSAANSGSFIGAIQFFCKS